MDVSNKNSIDTDVFFTSSHENMTNCIDYTKTGNTTRIYYSADYVMRTALEEDSSIKKCKVYYNDKEDVRCEPCNMGFKSRRSLGAHRVHCVHFQARKKAKLQEK